MKIVQINAVGQYGSTGRTCAEIQKYVNEKTNDECFTAFAVGEPDDHSYVIGSNLDHKIHALKARLTGNQGFFSKGATKKLVSYLKETNPDIVHLRNLHSNYVHLPTLLEYLASADIATVVTLHDCWAYTGGCCHYTSAHCGKWQTGCGKCPRYKADKSWFFDRTEKNWKRKKTLFDAIPRLAVVGVSDWITNEAKKSFLSSAKIVERIYNWIDKEKFAYDEKCVDLKKELGIEDKKIVLGVSSVWLKNKGTDEFVNLAAKLGDGFAVVLVGRMLEQIPNAPKNFISVPALSDTALLARYYSMADVFVTMSAEETFGKVSAEALSCGTPVICYDSTANKELVPEGCGVVIKPGDTASLEKAVRAVCENGRERYSDSCRAFVCKEFDMETQIKQNLDLYRRLCDIGKRK